MPRFVVLEHDHPRGLHWDFMLEAGNTLVTWAINSPPDAGGVLMVESLPDHRPAYLDYEGPVSGGRGSVTRWDQGTYDMERRTDALWIVVLSGEKLRGRAVLERTPEMPNRWRFRFHARPE